MKPYFQTTSFTTAAASLLTIISHLKPDIQHSKLREFDIWRSSVNLPTRASSIYALATYAKKCGLNPKVVVEKKHYQFPDYRFYRYTKEDVEHATFSEKKHLEKAEGANIPIEERTITLDEIQTHLQENKIISFVEKPKREEAPSNLINAGGFIIEPECLKILPEGKSSMEKDCFEKIAPLGEISAHVHEGQWFPTDTLEKYQHAYDNFKPLL